MKITGVFLYKCVAVLIELLLDIRRPAWGWPFAISQEERLSYGIGSPLALGG